MIPFAQAYGITLNAAYCLGSENVELVDSLNRILAVDVLSDMDMPPFDKSAMDGYACRRQDLGKKLFVNSTIYAGQKPKIEVIEGQCAKIMTGAMIPSGADCVIPIENVKPVSSTEISVLPGRVEYNKRENNICLRGEDIHDGQVVLKKGERISSQHVAVLASVGCS